jgi:hypothetical protein
MLTRHEISRGVYGAWLLLLGDRRGLDWIDRSPLGAWRSFLLAPLLFPFDLVNIAVAAAELDSHASWARILAVEIVTYTISWAAYPLVMLGLAPMLDRERQILGFIAVSNWTSTITSALSLILSLLLWSEILPDAIANLLIFVQLAILFVYGWFVIKTALEVRPMLAAGLSVLQLIIAIILSQITYAMIL